MKKLTSLEDTATITITGREAVMLYTLIGKSSGKGSCEPFSKVGNLLQNNEKLKEAVLESIGYHLVQQVQEEIAFPQASKKDLMLQELQSKMDALQCEIDKIKGESF